MSKIRQLKQGIAIVTAPAVRKIAPVLLCLGMVALMGFGLYASGIDGFQAIWLGIAGLVLIGLLIGAAEFVRKCLEAAPDETDDSPQVRGTGVLPTNVVPMPARMRYKRVQ